MTISGLFRGQVADLVGWSVGCSQRPNGEGQAGRLGPEKEGFKVFAFYR